MAVLDVQRRGQQIGRLRIGQQVGTGKFDKDGTRRCVPPGPTPSGSPPAPATRPPPSPRLFGGEVRDWEGEFEVITDTVRDRRHCPAPR